MTFIPDETDFTIIAFKFLYNDTFIYLYVCVYVFSRDLKKSGKVGHVLSKVSILHRGVVARAHSYREICRDTHARIQSRTDRPTTLVVRKHSMSG